MKRKMYLVTRKIFQATYITLFLVELMGLISKTPLGKYSLIPFNLPIFIITSLLVIGKINYMLSNKRLKARLIRELRSERG